MADASLASLKAQPTGAGNKHQHKPHVVGFVPTPIGNSGPGSAMPAANDPSFDPTKTLDQVRADKARLSKIPRREEQKVQITPQQLTELAEESQDIKDAIEALNKKYYNDNPPRKGESGFEDYRGQCQTLKAFRYKTGSPQDEERAETGEAEGGALLVGGVAAHGVNRAKREDMAHRSHRSHPILRWRRNRKRKLEEAGKRKAKDKLFREKGEKPRIKGEATYKAVDGLGEGRAAVAEGELALKNGKTVLNSGKALAKGKTAIRGLETVAKGGSKLYRLGKILAIGTLVGTALAIGGTALAFGIVAGGLAYKYGNASGAQAVASGVRAGGNALKYIGESFIPNDEAKTKFAEAGADFKKGNLWGFIKNGIKGVDEMFGISDGVDWLRKNGVQGIVDGTKTLAEAGSIVVSDPKLLNATLTVAGNMAAGNDTAQSMADLQQTALGNKDAVALAERNPELFGFGAVPKSAVQAPSSQAVTRNSDAANDEQYSVASNWGTPEPETG